jgi:hypothetical protein
MNSNDDKPLEEQIETTDAVAGDMAAEYLPTAPARRADGGAARQRVG